MYVSALEYSETIFTQQYYQPFRKVRIILLRIFGEFSWVEVNFTAQNLNIY